MKRKHNTGTTERKMDMNQSFLMWSPKEIGNKQIVDLRSQTAFQTGHLKGALNLSPKNLIKYGPRLLNQSREVILVVAEENRAEVVALAEDAAEVGIKNIVGYLVAEELSATEQEPTPTISAEAFMALVGDFSLLDVRHPDEITRPAPERNLVNIPLEELSREYQQLSTDQPVYTLCGSGNRATAAASFLKNKGYQPIVIEGGMGAVEKLRHTEQEQ